MDLLELKDRLHWANIPDRWYSLNEGLKPDACILYKNYSRWEFFIWMKKAGGMTLRFLVMQKRPMIIYGVRWSIY